MIQTSNSERGQRFAIVYPAAVFLATHIVFALLLILIVVSLRTAVPLFVTAAASYLSDHIWLLIALNALVLSVFFLAVRSGRLIPAVIAFLPLFATPAYALDLRTVEPSSAHDTLQSERQLLEASRSENQKKKDALLGAIEKSAEPDVQWSYMKMPLEIFKQTIADAGIVLEARNVPDSIKTISVNWKGHDVLDALKSVFPACNVEYKMYKYVLDCMMTKRIRLPFTYSQSQLSLSAAVEPATRTGTTSGGGTSPSTGPGASAQYSSARGNGADYTMTRNFDYYRVVLEEAKKLLSKQGTLSLSYAGGFAIVKDFMENAEAVEKFITSEVSATEQVKFQVKLVRVLLSRGHEYGIDWNQVLSNALTKNLTLSVTSAASVANPVLTVSGGGQNWDFLVKALSTYGNTSVLHSWDVVSKGGETVILKDVQDIPYVADVQTSQSTVSTITTPSFASQEVGLKIVLDFTKYRDEIDVNGVIDISTVKEFKQFTVSGFNIERPSVSKQFVRFQSKTFLGDSLVVSGFRIDSDGRTAESVPGVSKIPLIGWLFGHDKATKEKAEYLVVITPQAQL